MWAPCTSVKFNGYALVPETSDIISSEETTTPHISFCVGVKPSRLATCRPSAADLAADNSLFVS